MEYTGEGLAGLSVPERATIANMGAERGATTTVFPSDEVTREFFAAQGRLADWSELKADPDAEYDEEITIDLSALHPLAAMPHSPDNVARVADKAGIKIDQVAIGSWTNSTYADMVKVAVWAMYTPPPLAAAVLLPIWPPFISKVALPSTATPPP